MEHACCLGVKGIMVRGHVFTDLWYADNIALPSASRDELAVSLEHFSGAAGTMGFKVSWSKTKVQSTGDYTPSADVVVDGHRVKSVSSF